MGRIPGRDVNHIANNFQTPVFLHTWYIQPPTSLLGKDVGNTYLPIWCMVVRIETYCQTYQNVNHIFTESSPSLLLSTFAFHFSPPPYLLLAGGGLGGWSDHMRDIPPTWLRLKPHPHQHISLSIPQTSVSPVFLVVCLSVWLSVSAVSVSPKTLNCTQKPFGRNYGRGQIRPFPLSCHHLWVRPNLCLSSPSPFAR